MNPNSHTSKNLIESNATVWQTAKAVGVSKSTVYVDEIKYRAIEK